MPSMRCGGAERILTAMANYWAENGKAVTVLTFDNEDIAPFYRLSSRVVIQSLNVLGEAKALWRVYLITSSAFLL